MVFYKKALQLPPSFTAVSVPAEKLQNITKLRIEGVSYVTASSANMYALIVISGFEKYEMINSNGSNKIYTKFLLLNNQSAQQILYENGDSNYYDVVLPQPINVSNIKISVLINGDYSNDISPSNPMYLSLHFET